MDSMSIPMLEKRFKKEKKELETSDKMQTEFIKDLEIAVNDFFEAKFELKGAAKDLADDEEKLRNILTKLINLPGMRFSYKQKCRDWIDDLLSNRKKVRHLHSDDEDNTVQEIKEHEAIQLGEKRTAEGAGLPSVKNQP